MRQSYSKNSEINEQYIRDKNVFPMAIIYISSIPIIKIAVKNTMEKSQHGKTNPEYFESISESLFC